MNLENTIVGEFVTIPKRQRDEEEKLHRLVIGLYQATTDEQHKQPLYRAIFASVDRLNEMREPK